MHPLQLLIEMLILCNQLLLLNFELLDLFLSPSTVVLLHGILLLEHEQVLRFLVRKIEIYL